MHWQINLTVVMPGTGARSELVTGNAGVTVILQNPSEDHWQVVINSPLQHQAVDQPESEETMAVTLQG